jgi:hypothetical protein
MNTLRILGLPVAFAVLTSALMGSAARADGLEKATYKGQAKPRDPFNIPATIKLKVESIDQAGDVRNVHAVLSGIPALYVELKKIELQGTISSQGVLKLSGSQEITDPNNEFPPSTTTFTCRLKANVKGKEITGRYNLLREMPVPNTPISQTTEVDVAFKATLDELESDFAPALAPRQLPKSLTRERGR